ncbi:MAG: hypothetical protein K2F98_08500 [Bacteroides sp.]|nr:hypothetical protein [Bacteroides sp.]
MEEKIDFAEVPYQYTMCLNRQCLKANIFPHKQMQVVVSYLMSYLGRRTYYRSRKGERLLTPSEQQQVLIILPNSGVTHPQEFDSYIEGYDW